MADPGSVEARSHFWNEYQERRVTFDRCTRGSTAYGWHRLTRWWGLKTGLAILQAAYICSVGLGVVIAAAAASQATVKTPDEHGVIGFLLRWSGLILPACGVISVVYKTFSSNAGVAEEMPRREAVESLLRRVNNKKAINRVALGGQVEARLIEICEAVRRDAQELLQISESEVGVQILSYTDEPPHGPLINHLASDRAAVSESFQNGPRPALDMCVYEAVRLRRAVHFHDVMDVRFVQAFGEVKSSYRSFLCIPVTLPRKTEPYTILVVKLKRAYALWPKYGNVMDRRLALYVQLLTLYWAGTVNAKPS